MAAPTTARTDSQGLGSLRRLPGATWNCALLTVLTVAQAWLLQMPRTEAALRTLYFGLLYAFFLSTGLRYPHIRGLPMRLVEAGFAVLTGGFALGTVILFAGADHGAFAQLRQALENGAVFLLGTTLISYGLMLWIPALLEHHAMLRADFDATSGKLEVVEDQRSSMEQRLVEADRLGLLGALAAGVAHDLRNPLAIIKGTVESLHRRARTPEEIAEHVGVITRSIEKADRTIRALIDLGRPCSPRRVQVRLAEVAAEVLELAQLQAKKRRIVLRNYVPADLRTAGDPSLLHQALLNLVLNAMQAAPDDSRVEIRGRRFGSAVALAVLDRGAGLPAEVRSRLFSPFFTTKQEGTGLGLLSCRRIAADHGGRLGLFPRTRGGARAVLLLPAAPDLAPAGPPLAAGAVP